MLKAVTGMRQSDLQALNTEVLPRLLGKIRPEARRLLDLHRHAGRDTYIVSAAPQEIVEPLAHSLGMTSGIGTRSQVVDGMYTGELDGPFCYGEGKVEAMRELASWEGSTCRSATPTATRPATCRCSRRSAIRSPSTPTAGSSATPAATAGRS